MAFIQCPKCSLKTSNRAELCVHCFTPIPEELQDNSDASKKSEDSIKVRKAHQDKLDENRGNFGCGCLTILILSTWFFWPDSRESDNVQEESVVRENKFFANLSSSAWRECKRYVRSELGLTSNVDFPSFDNNYVRQYGRKYTVSAHVYAVHTYSRDYPTGKDVRHNFKCVIRWTTEERWSLESVSVR